MVVTLEIPDGVMESMSLPAADAETEVRKEIALALYARGLLSIGKAAELANATRREFEALLAGRRVERPYDAAEVDRDLAWARGKE